MTEKRWPSITCPECKRTSYNPNDIREGYCGFCHAWTTNPLESRPHNGPRPGTYLIVVELPPKTNPDTWMGLMKVFSFLAKRVVPGAYTHGSKVMPKRGKRGNQSGAN